MQRIPLELLPTIIGHDWEVYWALAMAIPSFGRSTLTTQDKWKARFTRVIKNDKGEKWLLAGKLHCDDGPSLLKVNGQTWYQHGLIHRDSDLPARVANYGSHINEEWFMYGKLHRENDMPACKTAYSSGHVTLTWACHGKIHRDGDKPAVENGPDCLSWYNHGKLHRDGDKPARIWPGIQEWYSHGELHREGRKPAVVYADGREKYYIHGVRRSYPTGSYPPP